ncbi:group I truncated hemoglobin [Roseateles oligotrophus]|uniref:Group 1 truncated hemoglobin n=1 Tax=Roseateles oligotrophus TaxID=1769250 RepID=A0ABT2YD02_9BURK|nr:group 1 truncated hemoglobin [Roseateles oligotrophus]MCV2367920.1 group 1 truncated hemoglobin [Roseateles oligotrophus]
MPRVRLLPPACLLLVLLGCAATPPASLFERLGGPAGVSDLMGRTLARAAADPRTQRSFEGIKLSPLQQSLTEQICALAGGGCRYQGETMARVHQDLHIKPSEFDAFVEMLRQEIDRGGSDARAKNELLRLLAPMKQAIVSP